MGGLKGVVANFGLLGGFNVAELRSSDLKSPPRGKGSVVLSSHYTPFPYKNRRDQVIESTYYPESEHRETE